MEDFQNIEQSQKIPFLESDEEQQPEEQIIEKKNKIHAKKLPLDTK